MKGLIKFYRLFNILSLDVATGAIVSSLFFAKIYGVVPPLSTLISLGLTVWLIYTTDRLLDVKDAKGEVTSERHQFHKRHQRGLVKWLMFIAIMDVLLIFIMPATIIKQGLLLATVVLVYVLLRRHLHVFKEFIVAVLYTIGVMIPAEPANHITLLEFLPLLQFFLIALLNLIIFSWYERENDVKDKQDSIATKMDDSMVRYILFGLFFLAFSIPCCMFFFMKSFYVSVIFLLMTGIHLMLLLRKGLFEKKYFYRLVGDAAFLLPLLYILL